VAKRFTAPRMPQTCSTSSESDARSEYSTRFHRDVKLAQKRGKSMVKLRKLLELLIEDHPCRLGTETIH